LHVVARCERRATVFRAAHANGDGAATPGFREAPDFARGAERLRDGTSDRTRPATPAAIRRSLQSVGGLHQVVKALEAMPPTDAHRIAPLAAEIARLRARCDGA
jgi:chemotaxis protein histidine kinase CheA